MHTCFSSGAGARRDSSSGCFVVAQTETSWPQRTLLQMAAGKIAPIITTFNRELDRAEALVAAIQALRRPPPVGPGHPGLPELQRNLVRELAFLRCVLAWEVLLEDSFIVYMTGGKGLSGKKAKSLVTAKTGPQARAILLGGRDYLSWSSTETVKGRARVWFSDGEPYITAFSTFSTNKEIRVVRNRIAHNSGEAKEQFNTLREKKVTNAAERRGMGPGAFLARTVGGHPTRFDAYLSDLRAAAAVIGKN